MAYRKGAIVFGYLLSDWGDDDELADAFVELEHRGFLSSHPSTISHLDWCAKVWPEQKYVSIVVVRTE